MKSLILILMLSVSMSSQATLTDSLPIRVNSNTPNFIINVDSRNIGFESAIKDCEKTLAVLINKLKAANKVIIDERAKCGKYENSYTVGTKIFYLN